MPVTLPGFENGRAIFDYALRTGLPRGTAGLESY